MKDYCRIGAKILPRAPSYILTAWMQSLWSMGKDSWAFCDGSGPVPLRKLVSLRKGVWLINGDGIAHLSLKAAAAAEGYSVAELKVHAVTKNGEARTVITYDSVMEILQSQGWAAVGNAFAFQ